MFIGKNLLVLYKEMIWNDPVYNGQEVGEASALLPYHNFF